MAGWRDAPVVDDAPASPARPAWMSAPVVDEPRGVVAETGRQVGLTGRIIGQGLGDLADFGANAVAAVGNGIVLGVNGVAGREVMPEPFQYNPFRRAADAGMDAVGLPRPEGAVENTVAAGGRAVAGGVAMGLPRALGALTQTGIPLLDTVRNGANTLFNTAVQGLGVRTTGEATVNALAGMGGSAAAQAAGDSAWAPVAGLAGGLAAGGVPAIATAAARGTARGVNSLIEPMRAEGPERIAANRMASAASDLPAVRNNLAQGADELVPGSVPTTAQQTGDRGLMALERGVATNNPAAFTATRETQNSARLAQLGRLEEGGDPGTVQSLFRRQLAELDARTDADVAAARGTADAANANLGGRDVPESYGSTLRSSAVQADDRVRDIENSLWRSIDPDGTARANPSPIRDAARAILAEQTPSARPLSASEQQIFGVAGGYPDVVPFGDIVQLRQNVNSAMREELRQSGRTPTYARLARFKAAIESNMESVVPAEAVDALRAASDATTARSTAFGGDGANPMEDILRNTGARDRFDLADSAVGGRVFRAGPQGAESVRAYRAAVGDQQALEALTDYAAMDFRRFATRADGSVDPSRARTWYRAHEDAMREFPDLQQRIGTSVQMQEAVEAATTRRTQALNEFNASAAARVINTAPESLPSVIGGIFSGPGSVAQARELRARIGGDAAALQGARRAIVENILSPRFVGNTEVGSSGQTAIRSDQFQTFVRNNRDGLRAFFSPAEIANIDAVAADLQRSARSQSGVRLPGGSNTAQDAVAGNLLTRLTRVLPGSAQAGGGGAAVGAAIGTMTAGPWGGLAGAAAGGAASVTVQRLRAAGLQRADELLVEAMLNPRAARILLAKATPQNEERLMRGLVATLNRSAAMGVAADE